MENRLLTGYLTRGILFLGLLCVFAGYYLVLTLLDFFSLINETTGSPAAFLSYQYPGGFFGSVLGMILCPCFLPFRRKDGNITNGGLAAKTNKPVLVSLGFILLITLSQFAIRSMGVEYWVSAPATVFSLALCTGMFYPLSLGVFFLFWKERHSVIFLAIAICAGILVRYSTMPLPDIYAADPFTAMNRLFSIMKWLFTAAGICFAVTICSKQSTVSNVNNTVSDHIPVSNRSLIFRLIGLSVVFNIINVALEMRLFPFMPGNAPKPDSLYIIEVVAIVLICAFFAGRAINNFFRIFLGFAVVLFILLPCLVLFSDYPRFIQFLNILVSVFRFTVWIVFTAVIMQRYKGGVWFYAAAASIYLTQYFSFFGSLIGRIIPDSTEFTIAILLVTSAAFVFLAARLIFPKTQLFIEPANIATLSEIFGRHKLSKREAEVAELMVKEGFEAKAIGERLCISTTTVKSHILSIYRKFDISKRGEFMAAVVNALQGYHTKNNCNNSTNSGNTQ